MARNLEIKKCNQYLDKIDEQIEEDNYCSIHLTYERHLLNARKEIIEYRNELLGWNYDDQRKGR